MGLHDAHEHVFAVSETTTLSSMGWMVGLASVLPPKSRGWFVGPVHIFGLAVE